MQNTLTKVTHSSQSTLLPLFLAQFICSYACTNMNVAISDIARSLGTTVHGVQIAITFFTLTMAALMIPGSKLTDIWGRRFCFVLGLIVYDLGALVAAFSSTLGVLIFGYALLEGVGSALLIPPVYILVTVSFPDVQSRAKSFGIISAAAGIGAAAGPLIGGLITTAISWRASFIVQALVVACIVLLSRRISDPGIQGARPHFDLIGALLSAAGLFFVVLGLLQSGTYGWFIANQNFTIGNIVLIPQGSISPVWLFLVIGALILLWFFIHIRSRERAGKEPLLSLRLFRSRVANLGLVTQNIQWLILQGGFFVISVFLQTVRGFNAIQTGLLLTPAIVGLLLSSAIAGRLAKRRTQRTLIRSGFVLTIVGMVLLLLLVKATSSILTFIPGLLLMGLGIGVMLTSSTNIVQSSFPERDQGEISGLSRSISNLGSSLGTAIVGSVLVTSFVPVNQTYGLAFIVVIVIACLGLIAALLLPSAPNKAGAATLVV
ncbi:MAG TPA: MFS transporter [Ktedonobacteraceae bacterium]|nr:MFS transporter [Ktedonobacteraceae bacterium]